MKIVNRVMWMSAFMVMFCPYAWGGTDQGKKQISVAYSFEQAELVGWLNGDKCESRYQVQRVPGEPLVPYQVARILLPLFMNVEEISVQANRVGEISVTDIPAAGIPIPISMGGKDLPKVKRNSDIYGSDNPYPQEIYRVGGVDSFRGYNILEVILYPVKFYPESKRATYYEEMKVTVTLVPSQDKAAQGHEFRGLVKDEDALLRLIDNPEALFSYYNASKYDEDVDVDSSIYEYIIVTTAALADEFQVLANWKANFVDGAQVVIVSDNANSDEIKSVINDYYTNHGTQYVLLGGDVGVITYKTKFMWIFPFYYANIAQDYWYANLDGGNDISYYEVYVGRAPVDNTEEARNFVNKVIAYEQFPKPQANLFHQSRVQEGNLPDSLCLATKCEAWVGEGYTNYELFEEDGGISKEDWIDFWRNDGVMLAHIGHGNTNIYLINYELGQGEVRWTGDDVSLLDNTFWPVHTSVACISGEFEAEDCLAEEYVKDPDNGAIATFMNDKYGFFETNNACAYSGEYIEAQFRVLYNDGNDHLGAILANAKHYLMAQAQSKSVYEWAWREFNLFGDPETPVLTVRSID